MGDLEQQNGSFKQRLGKLKKELMQKKAAAYLPLDLLPTDIMVMINDAWQHSFNNVVGNKKAICERG